jgi:menaquinone-9 beta-reductase
MYNSMCETEVFVCGGGPAGLAAAIAARLAGFEVTVADCTQPPTDKACGEGIMPDGLEALQKLGVRVGPAQGLPFVGIRFVDKQGMSDACFPHGRGLGVRRPVLHQALIDRAAELGIPMHWGVRVSALSLNGVSINGQTIRSRWVVCADGQQSRLRELAGLSAAPTVRRRFGFRRHYRLPPWSNMIEVYWSDVGQMYVTPVNRDELCVAFITRRSDLRFDQALPFFPEVCLRVAGAEFTRVMGAITATRKLRAVQRQQIALIGEASGSVDAITGEGLALAFHQALALADAMQRNDLSGYEKAHRRICRLPHLMAELMLAMDAHPSFRRRVFRAFSAEPSLFPRLLAIHTGALSPTQFGVRGTLSLGWRLLTA